MADLFEGTPLSPTERFEGWRRVRIGLSGLGGILLLIAVASSLVNRLAQQEQAPNGGVVAKDKSQGDGNEPMAELGVAPDSAPKVVVPAGGGAQQK